MHSKSLSNEFAVNLLFDFVAQYEFHRRRGHSNKLLPVDNRGSATKRAELKRWAKAKVVAVAHMPEVIRIILNQRFVNLSPFFSQETKSTCKHSFSNPYCMRRALYFIKSIFNLLNYGCWTFNLHISAIDLVDRLWNPKNLCNAPWAQWNIQTKREMSKLRKQANICREKWAAGKRNGTTKIVIKNGIFHWKSSSFGF